MCHFHLWKGIIEKWYSKSRKEFNRKEGKEKPAEGKERQRRRRRLLRKRELKGTVKSRKVNHYNDRVLAFNTFWSEPSSRYVFVRSCTDLAPKPLILISMQLSQKSSFSSNFASYVLLEKPPRWQPVGLTGAASCIASHKAAAAEKYQLQPARRNINCKIWRGEILAAKPGRINIISKTREEK